MAQHISPLPKQSRQQPTRSQNAIGSASNRRSHWRGVLGACEGASAAKPGPAPLPARTRPQQPLRGRRHSGGMEGMCHPGAPHRTGSSARRGAVPVRKGPFRDTTEYHRHLPSPCRPHRPREAAALWARERAPIARGNAANIHRGAGGVLGAGPAGRGAPGRCVLLSTSGDPSKLARSNLPFLEPFSHRFLPRGRLITCGSLGCVPRPGATSCP
jgi:hypothetical protein